MSRSSVKSQHANPPPAGGAPPGYNPSAEYARAFAPVWPNADRDDESPPFERQPSGWPQPVPPDGRSRPGEYAGASDRSRPLRMLFTLSAFLLLAMYGTIAFTAGDLLWFVKGFDSRPAHIIVYHDGGKRTALTPADPDFQPLAEAVQACLSQGLARPSGIGFSDASLLDAYARYVTVEALFDRPVKLHAWFNTGEPTRMLFPITGRHSELSLVVLGRGDKYLASPPVLNTVEPLTRALRELGYY